MKKFKIPLIILMSAFSAITLFICIWALLFFSFYIAFLSFIGVLVFLPIQIYNKRAWLVRTTVFVIGLVLLVVTIHIPIGEVHNRIKYLASKPRSKNTISSFSTMDKMGIYGLNLMMGLSAYPIYPEISKETLMMVFPCPKNSIRTFESDFAINSENVRNIIKEYNKKLITGHGGTAVKLKKRLVWNDSTYIFGNREARYALTLNPAVILLTASKRNSDWLINVSIKVPCRYPQNNYTTLISKPELKVEEGLFWILQQAGWLFPYTAEWKFTIDSDDERIK